MRLEDKCIHWCRKLRVPELDSCKDDCDGYNKVCKDYKPINYAIEKVEKENGNR